VQKYKDTIVSKHSSVTESRGRVFYRTDEGLQRGLPHPYMFHLGWPKKKEELPESLDGEDGAVVPSIAGSVEADDGARVVGRHLSVTRIRGRCYDCYFRQISSIFSEKNCDFL
jgi:hypothetical protein